MNFFLNRKHAGDADQAQDPGPDSSSNSNQATMSGDDNRFMARALKLAKKGAWTTHPNPMVGCVIVKDNNVVGEGWHRVAGEPHAEINALKMAGKQSQGATMYVTLEPCCHQGRTPPCTKAIIKSGISRIVVAAEDPNPLVNRAGISALQNAGIHVVTGIGRTEAKHQNKGFLKRITTGLPWVTLKIAASIDGKTAMSDGESQWITSEPARLDGHKLRARSSAVLTGVGTVLRDDPSMTARVEGVTRQPHRVILDTHFSTPVNAKILHGEGDVLILTSSLDDSAIPEEINKKARIQPCPLQGGRINLSDVMLLLGKQQYNSILVEAGSRLSGAMLAAGLVDEVVVYMAPDLLGSDGRGMFDIASISSLSDKIKFKFKSVTHLGRDLKIVLTPVARHID